MKKMTVGSDAKLLSQLGMGPHRVEHVPAEVDRGEVLRYLGYPVGVEPAARLVSILDEWVGEASRRATPRATYVVLPVMLLSNRRLKVQAPDGSETTFKGAIGEFLGAAECVGVFIATAGPGVERLATELMDQGDPLAGMIVNAVGAERAEAAESVVIDKLRASALEHGFAPTLPYSPGYCGMGLAEQRTLFGLFDKADVGVTLTESCLMQPLKSVSGLIGLGPAERVHAFGSPCDRCELYNCSMRR
jgi:hypothetical protein